MLPEQWEEQSQPLSGAPGALSARHGHCSAGMGIPCPWIPYLGVPGADPAHFPITAPLPKALLMWQQMQRGAASPMGSSAGPDPTSLQRFSGCYWKPWSLPAPLCAQPTAWECSGTDPDPGAVLPSPFSSILCMILFTPLVDEPSHFDWCWEISKAGTRGLEASPWLTLRA